MKDLCRDQLLIWIWYQSVATFTYWTWIPGFGLLPTVCASIVKPFCSLFDSYYLDMCEDRGLQMHYNF